MFKSAFNSSTLKGSVRATLLGRYYALRVIKACMTTYVDKNGDKVSTNVLSETTQATILTIALVCDYKSLMEALGEDSTGVTVANVKERFKTLYADWQDRVRLESQIDGNGVQSTFDAYVKAFDGHVSEMGDAIINLLGKETSYKQGKAIPLAGNMGLPRVQATEVTIAKDKNGKEKKSPASSWTSLGNLLWSTLLSRCGTRFHVLNSRPLLRPPASLKLRGPC